MKATGVVRKIDSLGRIVIPKEIRRTLKIRDFEDLEILVDDDSIILKKYSVFKNFSNIMDNFVDIISSVLNKNIIVTDMNEVVSCNKEISNIYKNSSISDDYIKILDKRSMLVTQSATNFKIIDSKDEFINYLFLPIIINGDVIGSLFLFSNDLINENDKLIMKLVLKFLEKNIEE